ncbi:TPA: hypothetical protein PP069_000585 [Serratia rubidaea]|nr:hypothetical protein [Serratia rubidaea]HDJ2770741.1 hypothetical protein [Serratia rubidaea]
MLDSFVIIVNLVDSVTYLFVTSGGRKIKRRKRGKNDTPQTPAADG